MRQRVYADVGIFFELRLCIYDELREGNTAPGYGQRSFYRECKARMPECKRIGYYRADSASYQAELINELEVDRVKWAITGDKDSSVKGVIARIGEGQWKEPVGGCGYEVAESVHTMGHTKEAFRLVIKREVRKQEDLFERGKYKYHAVATNWDEEEKKAYEVLQWHNQRGEAENFNKELKNGFGMEGMPCGRPMQYF